MLVSLYISHADQHMYAGWIVIATLLQSEVPSGLQHPPMMRKVVGSNPNVHIFSLVPVPKVRYGKLVV